jgi:hypothetical protein
MTIILDFAAAAGAAILRDITPPNRSIIRGGLQIIGHGWQDKKALEGPLPPYTPAPKPPRPAGPIVMYDSVTVERIPANATHIACYLNGLYANAGAMRKRFPHAVLVTITIDAEDLLADCIDCETGDATPAQAAGWAIRKIRRGEIPKIYANRSTMPFVWHLLQRAGVKRDQVKLWVADWTEEAHIPEPYDACQWHGGMTVPYDESLCLASFF